MDEVANIAAGLLSGVLTLTKTDMPCDHVKIHLTSALDKQFLSGVAHGMEVSNVINEFGPSGSE